MSKTLNLLIIEDEEAIRDLLGFSFPKQDFNLRYAEDSPKAERLLATYHPDLIILDWMLPGKSGIAFMQWLRNHELLQDTPVIMLTARVEESYKIRGLEVGADDYVTKPFSPPELVARVKSVLRRGRKLKHDHLLRAADLLLDMNTQVVQHGGHHVNLPHTLYRLLYFFMTHCDRSYSRDQIISLAWGREVYLDERSIDVQIRRLRELLKPISADKYIETVRGIGYRFSENAYE